MDTKFTRERTAHRSAYRLTKGPIDKRLEVQHLCNNKRCCNPNHLKLGTRSENCLYKSECCRQAKGENTSSAILTDEDVIKIRQFHKENPKIKQKRIAEMYNVSPVTICQIINRTRRTVDKNNIPI